MEIRFQASILSAVLLLGRSSAWVSKDLGIPSAPFSSSYKTELNAAVADGNVVLKPSGDASAFDSFKVGNPRVHRYGREHDPDSETEYVMWYHGRSRETSNDEDKNLPPLSTGRIGRATSRNGLVWEKDRQGSESEDAPDVSLGLNKDSWWGFDTAHVGLGNVLLPMSTPGEYRDAAVRTTRRSKLRHVPYR